MIKFRHISYLLTAFALLLPTLFTAKPDEQTTAQDGPATINRLAVFMKDEEVYFYNVDADGQFTLLVTLEDTTILEPGDRCCPGRWEIVEPNDIKLSPDRRYIAFTAEGFLYPAHLFMYDVMQNTLLRYDAPGIGSIRWSPDSSALLLSPSLTRIGRERTSVNDTYLFTLAIGQFERLTATITFSPWRVRWLSSDEFVYTVGDYLYRMDRDGERFQVVDSHELLSPDNFGLPFPITVAWEPSLQRLYVSIMALSAEKVHYPRLYSFDRFGNSRLELDFYNLFPYGEGAGVVNAYIQSTHEVIVLVNGSTHNDAYADIDNYWQVYHLTSSGERSVIKTEIMTNDTGSLDTITSDLSPNERFLAISEWRDYQEKAIVILDLLNGQTTAFDIHMTACHIEWLDDRFLQLALDPNCVQSQTPDDGSWLLDTVSGDIQQITGGLDGYVWVLPQPDIEPNNFSPYADAGPDQMAFLETPIRLDASQSVDTDGQIVAYEWRRDGVIIAEGVNPTVFLPDGQHTLTLTVIDDDGAIGRDQVRIHVR